MTVVGTLALLLASAVPCGTERAPDPDLRRLYERGIPFAEFLSEAERRRRTWLDNADRAAVPDSVLRRARAVGGPWRLLVVAEDWCGDSANTIPYLAKLVDAVDGLEMRIVDSRTGRPVMESHRTPDGRPATPTVVLLDAAYEEAGCWIERPAILQRWFLSNEAVLDEDDLYDRKYEWYDADAGASTVAEIVVLLEAAAAGAPQCGARNNGDGG